MVACLTIRLIEVSNGTMDENQADRGQYYYHG